MPTQIMLNPKRSNQDGGCKRLSTITDIGPCQHNSNLLAKTLAARIRGEDLNRSLQLKAYSQSETNLLHLASSNKERNTFVGLRGESRLDSRSREERKNRIRERLARQRLWERLTRPENFHEFSLPDIDRSSAHSDSIASKSTPKSGLSRVTSFGDTDDHIGMVKRGGVFQPINLYTPSRYQHKVDESPFKKPIIDYECIEIPPSGCLSTEESKVKRKRSGLRVTFSNTSWSEDGSCPTDRGSDDNIGQRPKVTTLLHKPSFKPHHERIASVGLAWEIAPNATSKPTSNAVGHLSRDLHPVTSGLNKAGTSESQTKWRVQSSQNFNRPFMPLRRFHVHSDRK